MAYFLRNAAFAALAVCCMSTVTQAGVVWDESVDGQASSNRSAPTSLSLAAGGNDVIGSIGPNAGTNDDIYSFVIGVGQSLTSITLVAYSVNNGSRFDIYHGSTAGASFGGFITTAFGNAGVGVGGNLLLGGGPLGPGTYSIGLQESNNPVPSYRIRLNVEGVTAVPEPSTMLGACLAGLSAAGFVARKRKSA